MACVTPAAFAIDVVLAMNIFPALMSESIQKIMTDDKLTQERYMALRKAENIEIIMRRIQKQ